MHYAHVCIFIFMACALSVSTQTTNITIPLNKILTYSDKELYGDFIHINGSSTILVDFSNVNPEVTFIIFQVHSHLYHITLYKNVYVRGSFVTGTNVGLYSSTKRGLENFYIQNPNENALKLFVAVMGYGANDPIPGGCNMEFPVPISPFLVVAVHNKTYIDVDAAAPQIDVKCLEIDYVTTEFYMVYLPEHNFEPGPYFDAVRMMSNYQSLMASGNVRWMNQTKWPLRRMVSAYPGTGAVYVAIAKTYDSKTNTIAFSMYVPAHSYACSPLVENDCELLEDSLSMLICALLLFIGLFICYFGHRFFKTQLVILGFLIGLVTNYILLSLFFDLDHPALLAASAISGLCVGILLWVFWWLYGLPIVVIVAFCFQIGFLIACIFYYIAPAPWVYYVSQDLNFWSIFFLIMMLVTICLITVSHIVNILCCTVVGGYVAIYSMDYYLGSNMKYILNNIVRRATVNGFRRAIVMPTFQFNDWILSFLWIILIITGFIYQFRQNKGKPPFPPPPRSVRAVPEEPVPIPGGSRGPSFAVSPNERTPLLA